MIRRLFAAYLILVAGLACLWQAQAQMMPLMGAGGKWRAAVAAGTSYVTGNRDASITITTSRSDVLDAGTASSNYNLVDGGFGTNSSDSTFFSVIGTVANEWIKFDFGTGKIVDEAKWYQDTSDGHGTWKWQGSNDNSAWTDVGSSFTLGGTATQTQTSLNGNSTSYRYYRLLGVSGAGSLNPWLEEIEFKQNFLLKRDLDPAANDNTPAWLNHVA